MVEAVTDPEVPPLPPHITLEQAKALSSAADRRRPERRADRAAVLQAEGAGVPAGPMTADGHVAPEAAFEQLEVAAYTIPTDAPEADGTLALGLHDDRRRARPAAANGARLHVRRRVDRAS